MKKLFVLLALFAPLAAHAQETTPAAEAVEAVVVEVQAVAAPAAPAGPIAENMGEAGKAKLEALQKANKLAQQQKLMSEGNIKSMDMKTNELDRKLKKLQSERANSAYICGDIPVSKMETVRGLAIGTTVTSGVGTLAGAGSIMSSAGVFDGKKSSSGSSASGTGTGTGAVSSAAGANLQKASGITHATTIGASLTSVGSTVMGAVALSQGDFDSVKDKMRDCISSFSLDY
jgi:hypothetical protein